MPEINPFVAALFLRASDCVNCCILLITIWKSARLLSASLEGAKTLMAATVMRWSVPISSLDKDNPSSSVCSAPVLPGSLHLLAAGGRPELSCSEVGKGRQESALNALGSAKGDRPTGKNALNMSADRGARGSLEGHCRGDERRRHSTSFYKELRNYPVQSSHFILKTEALLSTLEDTFRLSQRLRSRTGLPSLLHLLDMLKIWPNNQ